MIDSLHRIEFVRRWGERPLDARRMDPTSALFDPVKAAYLHARAGNKDEAAWLVFLDALRLPPADQVGSDAPSLWRLGGRAVWTWNSDQR